MKTSYETKGKQLLWVLFGLVAFEILLSTTVSGYAISSKALDVGITSPENGQQVPVSKIS
ncbi:MAG: hypothetical protein DLM72_19290 [Candidatus Nitrosopolaris wilkensis]|nr:MAG: hypothetical protein DLM72_19290 [Candidatus Nitrosopolaris wilkensis]